MVDLETRLRDALRQVREALSALEQADPAVLREAAQRVEKAGYEAATRKLEEMFLPELHQARWAERLAQLRDEKRRARTEAERDAIQAQIMEHYDHRHDTEMTRLESVPISAAQFWNMKREGQERDHALVRSGQVPQRSLYFLKSEDLQGAKIKWPDRSSSSRGLLREILEAGEADSLLVGGQGIPRETPSECLREIERVLVRALEYLKAQARL